VTLDEGVTIQTLKMMVGGGGSDQIVLGNSGGQNPTFYSLSAQMNWSADGVQINFSGTGNSLVCKGGNIKSFDFTGAKGTFTLAMTGTGTTTWNTAANSTTDAQIDVEGGIFDLKGTGSITSYYNGYDVYVAVAGTLKFDYLDNVTVADLFDNGNDGSGYIVTIWDGTTGAGGTVTTTSNLFDVTNNMPIRNNGSVTVDKGKLTFNNVAIGSGRTNGVSYYQTSNNTQASTTVLHGGTLGSLDGLRQDGGNFNVGYGGAKIRIGDPTLSADFEGGYIKFPSAPSTDYEVLTVSQGNLIIKSTTVNMKLNGQSGAAGNNDVIVCTAGTITIGNSSVLNVMVNNSVKSGLTWEMLISTLGIDKISGRFNSITPLNTFTASIVNGGADTNYDLTAI
jgi:hypothetical protein